MIKAVSLLPVGLHRNNISLSHERAGSGRLVLPVGWELAGGSVVTRESMDAAFDEDQSELAVLILAIDFQMLTNLDSFFDEHVQIFGDFGCQPVGLEDANNLLSGH